MNATAGPGTPGAAGPEGGPADPAGGPPDEPEQGFIRELSQFFIVPSLIVLLSVAVFIMFGLITSHGKQASEYLQEVRHGSGSERWLAAFELSRALSAQPDLREDRRLAAEVVAILEEEREGDPMVRIYLVGALANLEPGVAGPALIASLEDADPNVRFHAVRSLGASPAGAASVAPLGALLADEDPSVRKLAAYALGRTGAPAAVAHLRPRLDDPIEDVRWNAALALASLRDGSGRGVVLEMMDRGHLDAIEGITEEQKIAALINGVQAAWLLRDPELIAAVERIGREDPSLRVREVALRVIEEIPR